MGSSTTFLGRLDINPRLNVSEIEWLRAFAAADRRHYTEPYGVAMNPRAFAIEGMRRRQASDRLADPDPFTSLVPLDGTPYPHLDWVPCVDGCCLGWNRSEKSRMAEPWLQYLIDHFLRPVAHASEDPGPAFEQFTFNHVLSGVIAGERDDTRELVLIRCEDNAVRTQVLVPGDVMPWEMPTSGLLT